MKKYQSSLPISQRSQICISHRCDHNCKYFVDQIYKVAICKESKHTHSCGPEVCKLCVKTADTTHACPITGFEIVSHDCLQYASFSKPCLGTKNKKNMQHWTTSKRRLKTNPKILQMRAVTTLMKRVFLSAERKKITNLAKKKLTQSCSAILLGKDLTLLKFLRIRREVEKSYSFTRPMPTEIPSLFTTYICNCIDKLHHESSRRNIKLKKNDACIAYGLLQLFSEGFSPQGITTIHPVKFVQDHGLTPNQYAKIPGLRARQQTIAVRQIQRLCVNKSGAAIFTLPQFEN